MRLTHINDHKCERDSRTWSAPTLPPGDLADIAAVQALLPHRRPVKPCRKPVHGHQPAPVYVATYADGQARRFSFYSDARKPIDFARGFNAALILGRSVPTAGHVEHDGATIEDPHFTAAMAPPAKRPRAASAAVRLAKLVTALNRGDIHTAFDLAKQEAAATPVHAP